MTTEYIQAIRPASRITHAERRALAASLEVADERIRPILNSMPAAFDGPVVGLLDYQGAAIEPLMQKPTSEPAPVLPFSKKAPPRFNPTLTPNG
jgi:hypothetical protein